MAGAFEIGEDKTRVAVVQYSTDSKTEINLNQYHKRGDLLRAISTLTHNGGNAMTGTDKTSYKAVCGHLKSYHSLIGSVTKRGR